MPQSRPTLANRSQLRKTREEHFHSQPRRGIDLSVSLGTILGLLSIFISAIPFFFPTPLVQALVLAGILLALGVFVFLLLFYRTQHRRIARLVLVAVVISSCVIVGKVSTQSSNTHSHRSVSEVQPIIYRGHHGAISKIIWSPDGKRITSYSTNDRTVQMWNATTGDILNVRPYYDQTLGASTTEVPSPDGNLVASFTLLPLPQNPYEIYHEGVLKVFNAGTGKNVFPDKHLIGNVTQVAWSPDSRLLAFSQGPTIIIVDAINGTVKQHYSGNDFGCCMVDNYVYALSWSPDGNFIASAGMEGPIQIWGVATKKLYKTYSPHCPPSLEGDTVDYIHWQVGVAGLSQMVIECFSALLVNDTITSNHATVQVLSLTTNYNYSYDGNQATPIFSISEMSSSAFCEPITDQSHFYPVVWSMSPDDGYIAYTCRETPSIISVWSIAKKRNIFVYRGHTEEITALSWSPDSQYIASGSNDTTVQVWKAVKDEVGTQ